MAIFLTADTHFGHNNIIKYCDRPFEFKEEHDNEIITRWNSVVNKNDIVYHLGDFGFGNAEYLHKICQKLKGQINLILGNHDHKSFVKKEPYCKRFGFIKEVHCGSLQVKGETFRVFLSHYAHRTWPFKNYGSYHFYGHSHNKLPPFDRSCDVGVDVWNFTPILLEDLIIFLKDYDTREYNKVPNNSGLV